MSQQLLMWNISPFLIQQLKTEGLTAFEIFWTAEGEFNVGNYEENHDIELSQNLKLNAVVIFSSAAVNNSPRSHGVNANIVHNRLS